MRLRTNRAARVQSTAASTGLHGIDVMSALPTVCVRRRVAPVVRKMSESLITPFVHKPAMARVGTDLRLAGSTILATSFGNTDHCRRPPEVRRHADEWQTFPAEVRSTRPLDLEACGGESYRHLDSEVHTTTELALQNWTAAAGRQLKTSATVARSEA